MRVAAASRRDTDGAKWKSVRPGRTARQHGQDTLEDGVDVAYTIDRRQLADLGKMLSHRRSLLAVNIQTLAHNRRIVVRPMLSREALFAARQDRRVGNVELDRDVQRLAQAREQRFQRLALDQVARIAVENEAAADVGIGQALFE